jgi:hypothetical protein
VEIAEFRESLHLGLGRAILYAREHDVREFRDVILDACLHCYAYDGRLYGTHAHYMHDLVSSLPDKDFYYGEVLKSLPGSGEDDDALLRFEFASCLASNGSEEARQAMYDSYHPGPITGEWIGGLFLSMEGIQGLLFAAEKIGALLLAGEKVLDAGSLTRWNSDTEQDEAIRKEALREAGTTNPRIEAYRLAAEASERKMRNYHARQDFSTLKYERVFEEVPIDERFSRIALTKWGEQASDEELALAAQGLIAAKDPKQQLAHLHIFAQRCFPLDVSAVLALVDVDEEQIGPAAAKALANISHPLVRDLAFRLIETRARWRGEVIDLIAQNYEPGDHKIVLRWFQEEEDRTTRHALGLDLRGFWERHTDAETEALMLRTLYKKGPCSFCRESAVRRLIALNALPDDLRTECFWDTDGDIRDLVNPEDTPSGNVPQDFPA